MSIRGKEKTPVIKIATCGKISPCDFVLQVYRDFVLTGQLIGSCCGTAGLLLSKPSLILRLDLTLMAFRKFWCTDQTLTIGDYKVSVPTVGVVVGGVRAAIAIGQTLMSYLITLGEILP